MFPQSIGTMDVNIGSKITRKWRGIRDCGIENTVTSCSLFSMIVCNIGLELSLAVDLCVMSVEIIKVLLALWLVVTE